MKEQIVYIQTNSPIKGENCVLNFPDNDKYLKPTEGIFFTKEEFNEFLKKVIEDSLNTASEKAKVQEEYLDDDEYREKPLEISRAYEFIADKGYEDMSLYRYKANKESITNTFNQTYEKWKV